MEFNISLHSCVCSFRCVFVIKRRSWVIRVPNFAEGAFPMLCCLNDVGHFSMSSHVVAYWQSTDTQVLFVLLKQRLYRILCFAEHDVRPSEIPSSVANLLVEDVDVLRWWRKDWIKNWWFSDSILYEPAVSSRSFLLIWKDAETFQSPSWSPGRCLFRPQKLQPTGDVDGVSGVYWWPEKKRQTTRVH